MPKAKVATPEMLNAIRNESSEAYQNSVPVATQANLAEVGNAIINYEPVRNEFVNALINKIVLQLINRRTWKNPLEILRRENMPLGFDVEDIHVNPAEGVAYDGNETGMADLLKMHQPDVASVYYRLNRQDKYRVTINNQQLRGAFTAWSKLEDLIAAIVDSLYNGCTIDEFSYMKSLVSGAVASNQIITLPVANPVNEETGKAFMKTMRTVSTSFTFPSANYNSYAQVTGKPARMSWCPIDEQVILIRGDVASAVGVDVLATLFNLNYGDYLARQIIVDNFGDDDTLAVIADEQAFIIMPQLREFATFYNASSLGWQYYYHAWDLFAMSLFRNAVALKAQPATNNLLINYPPMSSAGNEEPEEPITQAE